MIELQATSFSKHFCFATAICLLAPHHNVMPSAQANMQQAPTVQQFPKDSPVKNNSVKDTPTKWQLKWSDEFDKDGLPDPAKWGYEEGLVRNNEAQFYTTRSENARVEGGVLVIEGRKEEFANPGFKEGSDNWKEQKPFASYTSASLTTQGKASWQYGRIEVRAKIPQGKGIWPAIWTLGDNITQIGWPHCGEIDIMEFVGKEPEKIHATTHFALDGKHSSKGNSIKVNKPFDKPHFLLINLALGGAWGGEIDDAVLPQKYLIDYVRVYQAQQAGDSLNTTVMP
jgi:beta-glucanase (GH16 family)